MKKLALILLCGVASMALAEEYTIQAISALKESSITPAFEQKIKKTGIPYIKKIEGDRHVVLLGSYKKESDAKPTVKKVRVAVTKGAFVRPMDRSHVVAASVTQGVVAQTSVAVINPVDTTHPVAVAAAPVVVSSVVEKKEEPAGVSAAVNVSPSSVVVICDRNALRKNDISEALEYYKNSPYYTFRPVASQR